MFGTERPGSGGGIDPTSGRPYDDLRPVIEGIATIDEAVKKAIFEGNALKFFSRLEL
jgi:4-oxalmesaconate hydratase